MTILNIHGYKGSAKNALCSALEETGYTVISPELDYDSLGAEATMSQLLDIIRSNKIEGISGTSLGGFFAVCCSATTQLPALLVNPAILPELIIPDLGYAAENYASEFLRVRRYMADFSADRITAVIGDSDEIITDNAIKVYTRSLLSSKRTIHIPDGKHSGATLPLTELLIHSELLRNGAWIL